MLGPDLASAARAAAEGEAFLADDRVWRVGVALEGDLDFSLALDRVRGIGVDMHGGTL